MTHDSFISQLKEILGEQLTPVRETNARDIIKYKREEELESILDSAEDDPEQAITDLDNHKHVVDQIDEYR
jgi:hypothetical protein